MRAPGAGPDIATLRGQEVAMLLLALVSLTATMLVFVGTCRLETARR